MISQLSVPATGLLGWVGQPVKKIRNNVREVTEALFNDLATCFSTVATLSLPRKLFSLKNGDERLTEIFARLHHLAIIPDGNRTWGRMRGLTPAQSHRYVVDTVIPGMMRHLYVQGLHTLTIWFFSTENWRRDSEEVANLMTMLEEQFAKICLPICHEHKVRVVHLGRKDRLPGKARQELEKVERETARYSDHVFNVAIDYGGEDEIKRAAALGGSDLMNHLDTADQPHPYPDYIIRTSGQSRLSGFMPLQSAYSELYFEKRPFPEMSWQVLVRALEEYSQRQRRYGR